MEHHKRIAIGPVESPQWVRDAVVAGGGEVVDELLRLGIDLRGDQRQLAMHATQTGSLQRKQMTQQMVLWPEDADLYAGAFQYRSVPTFDIACTKAINDQTDIHATLSGGTECCSHGIADGVSPDPTFDDGVRCQAVLDAIEKSAGSKQWVSPEY